MPKREQNLADELGRRHLTPFRHRLVPANDNVSPGRRRRLLRIAAFVLLGVVAVAGAVVGRYWP